MEKMGTSWVLLSILVGCYASSKKRSFLGWFLASLIFSPIIVGIILLLVD